MPRDFLAACLASTIAFGLISCRSDPTDYGDGTKTGDIIIGGDGGLSLPDDGILFHNSGGAREPKGKMSDEQVQLAIAVFLPKGATSQKAPDQIRTPDWIYRKTYFWNVKAEDGKTGEIRFNYELDGRNKKLTIDGPQFDMASGKWFVVVIDDKLSSNVKQYDFDLWHLNDSSEQVVEKFQKHFPNGARAK
jgi:hypothetical protein